MLGTRAGTRELSGRATGTAARTWAAESAGTAADRAAIEDRLAALNAWALWCRGAGSRRRWGDDGGLVDRARTRLRHDNAPDGGRSRRSCCGGQFRCRSCSISRSRLERGSRLVGGGRWSCRAFSNRSGSRSGRNGSRGLSRSGRRSNRRRSLGLHGHNGRRLSSGSFFGRGRSHRRFDHNCASGWNHCDSGTCRRRRRLGNNRPCRRLGGNGAGRLRRTDNGRRLPGSGNNFAGFRTRRSCCRRRCDHGGLCRHYLSRCSGRCARGGWSFAGFGLSFLLAGKNGLHHVSRLGDIREIYFGCNALGATSAGTALATVSELRAYLLGFVFL